MMNKKKRNVQLFIDDPIISLDVKLLLEANNYFISGRENNIREGITFNKPSPDIIIISHHLLQKNYDFMNELKRIDTNICFLSDQPELEDEPILNELKYVVVEKPFKATELINALNIFYGSINY